MADVLCNIGLVLKWMLDNRRWNMVVQRDHVNNMEVERRSKEKYIYTWNQKETVEISGPEQKSLKKLTHTRHWM